MIGQLALAEGANYDGIMSAVTGAISPATVAGVLTNVATAALALVFFWWAARKVTQVLFSAFRSGKFHF